MLTRRFIRIKVFQTAYQYGIFQSANVGDSPVVVDVAIKLLHQSFENFQTLQEFLLELLPLFQLRARFYLEDEKAKNYPSYELIKRLKPFVEDSFVAAIDQSDVLDNDYVRALRENVSNDTFIRVFQQFTHTHFYYDYLHTPAADRKNLLMRSQRLAEKFYTWLFQSWYAELEQEELQQEAERGHLPSGESGLFQKFFLQAPISYSTDFELANTQLVDRLLRLKENPDRDTKLLSKPLQSDDLSYAETLLLQTIRHTAEHQELIRANLSRWELDRIKVTDRLLIELGITELLYCQDVPTQVTLSEYVDIANLFGANEQLSFVNGILDNIHTQLRAQGRIEKHAEIVQREKQLQAERAARAKGKKLSEDAPEALEK